MKPRSLVRTAPAHASVPDRGGHASSIADARPRRRKISITVEGLTLKAVKALTDNVSEFYDRAARRELYFMGLEAEAAVLRAEGVELHQPGLDWLLKKIQGGRRRRSQR